VVAVGVVGFIAATLGDNVGYAIGHFGGRALALRWGKYVFLTEERLNRAETSSDVTAGRSSRSRASSKAYARRTG